MTAREGFSFTHWVTEKTSNDELYMFKIQCMEQEFGKATKKTGDIEYEKWRHIKLNEPVKEN